MDKRRKYLSSVAVLALNGLLFLLLLATLIR